MKLHELTCNVLDEVYEERCRQDEKWGEQNHPSLDAVLMNREGGCNAQRMAEEYEIPTANRARFSCDKRFRDGEGSWGHILIEEVAEAIEAGVTSEEALREELIQVAAVVVAWVECIDRRKESR